MAVMQAIPTAGRVEADASASFMLPYCKLTAEQASASAIQALLLGQCQGVIETISQMHQAQLVEDRALCADIPDSVTHGQLVQVVVKYGELHPDQTHKPFWMFVLGALHNAWPCKK
jgi:hypothetical protein